MKCGRCKRSGDDITIQHVRACYGHASTPPSQVKAQAGTAYGPKDPVPFPEGRYAVMLPDSKLHFFKVDKPTEGRWAGFVFVKEQASDEFYPVRGERRNEVLRTIAINPEGAMLAYGRHIGRCGHCGRTLTNEESRTVGIGPICRSKVSF